MQFRYEVFAAHKTVSEDAERVSEDAFACAAVGAHSFIVVVVDAHGQSNRVAAELAAFTAKALVEQYSCVDTVVSYSQLFLAVQQEVIKGFSALLNGAVATCFIVDHDKVIVAHVGNCRVYSFDAQTLEAAAWTKDHDLENPLEAKRLKPFFVRGTFAPVLYRGRWRLFANANKNKSSSVSLLSTRGFGNPDFHPAFTYLPEVQTVPLDLSQQHLFAITTDGGVEIVRRTFIWAKMLSLTSLQGVVGTARRRAPEVLEDDALIVFLEISPTS